MSIIIVTGSEGMLGSAVMRAGERNGLPMVGLTKRDLDITDRPQVAEVLGRYQDPIVVNCAGIVRGRPETTFMDMYRVDTLGPQILAKSAARLLHVSTDCVFDGWITEGAYKEDDAPCPLDAYGQRKLEGEVEYPPHVTVRASFVGLGQRGLLRWLLDHPQGAEVPGYMNWLWNGWTASTLACMLLPIAMESRVTGLVHLPGPEVITKGGLLTAVAERLRPDLTVVSCDGPEPSRMVLASKYLMNIPNASWTRMLDELEEEYSGVQA